MLYLNSSCCAVCTIHNKSKLSKLHSRFEFLNLFADNILVACTGSKLDSVLLKIKWTLENLNYYFKMNKLKLNVVKIKAMLLGTK